MVFVWEASGAVFLIVVACETGLNIAGFPKAIGSKVGWVAVVICILFGALDILQAVIADLQPAASGPMTAEKQPSRNDDC